MVEASIEVFPFLYNSSTKFHNILVHRQTPCEVNSCHCHYHHHCASHQEERLVSLLVANQQAISIFLAEAWKWNSQSLFHGPLILDNACNETM